MFLASDSDDESDRGPFADFWSKPVARPTMAGVRVDDEAAMRLAFAYGCINVISQDIAKIPLAMYRRLDNETTRKRVYDHPAIKVLQSPAHRMTSVDWRERLQAHQLTRGNGYCEKQYDYRGQWKALPPWRPDNVRTELMADGSVRYHVRNPTDGTERVYLEDEVLHLRGLSIDGPLGLSPIDQARETLGEGLAAQSYGATFFANDARPSIAIQRKDNFKDETLRKEWTNYFKRAWGGRKRFSPILLEYGMELKEVPQLSHVDIQFLELRKFKGYEICAIYRVPPHKVAILERSTNNNIEHQGIEYVTDCLLTWCRRWEERLGADLLDDTERDEFFFEFNLDSLMRGDMETRYAAYNMAVGGPWMVRNEARRRENMPPIDGFDQPLDALNMQGPATQTNTRRPRPAGAPQQDPEQAGARGESLELQARRRVLNREAKALTREWERAAGDGAKFNEAVSSFYVWHAPFVAEALVVSREVAEAYCLAQCAQIERAASSKAVPAIFAAWEADAQALNFSPLPAAQPRKE
jgi:HK97 family phage portal protein